MSLLPPRVNRWLLASLALNVALGAALALPYAAPDQYGRHPEYEQRARNWRESVPSIWRVRRLLGEERSALVKSVMQEHSPGIRATFPPRRAARDAVRWQMRAEPLDADALRHAFAELRTRDADASTAIQDMLVDLLLQLTPGERNLIIEGMPGSQGRGRDRGGPAADAD